VVNAASKRITRKEGYPEMKLRKRKTTMNGIFQFNAIRIEIYNTKQSHDPYELKIKEFGNTQMEQWPKELIYFHILARIQVPVNT